MQKISLVGHNRLYTIDYFLNDLNVSNVSVKNAEAIIYQGLWGTGPFMRGGVQLICGGTTEIVAGVPGSKRF